MKHKKCPVYNISSGSAYKEKKCRCEVCRKTHSILWKNRRPERRQFRKHPICPVFKISCLHSYDYNRCRCYVCISQKHIRAKKYRQSPKGKKTLKANMIMHRYNLTDKEYRFLKKNSCCKCMICKKKKPLTVDHDHKTKKVRGLLCDRCNVGLGCFKDDKKLLKSAIMYLKR